MTKRHIRGRIPASGYKGVYRRDGNFKAVVWVEGKSITLGHCRTAVEAAILVARYNKQEVEARRLEDKIDVNYVRRATPAEEARAKGYRCGSNDRAIV